MGERVADQNHTEWQVMSTIGDVGVILVVAAAVVFLARLLRQPAVIGEIAAGIMLGPSLLGLLPGDLPERIFPTELRPHLSIVAQVGVLLFLFAIGWEFNPGQLRGRKRAVGVIWLASIGVPLVLGAALALALYGGYGAVDGQQVPMGEFITYIAVAMSVTAFPVLARIISEHGLQRSRVGVLALALAALDDVLAWFLMAVVVALATTSGAGGFVVVVLWSAVYIAAMFWVVRPLLRWAARAMRPGAQPYALMLVTAGIFLSSFVTSQIGIHAVFGAFLFGLVMPRGVEPLRRTVEEPLRGVGVLLMPVFFVVTGLSVDLTTLAGGTALVTAAIVAVACLAKLGGVAVPARLTGMGTHASVSLGLLMNTRGLTQLVVLNVGLELGLLNVELFTALVVMALVTTAMASPLLSVVVRRGLRAGCAELASEDEVPPAVRAGAAR